MSSTRKGSESFKATAAATASDFETFPFQTVIVTFPDARAAHAADTGPLQQLRDAYANRSRQHHNGGVVVEFIASTDPYGCRVGSGGGTLAALMDANKIMRMTRRRHNVSPAASAENDHGGQCSSNEQSSILILHAGGASSRCPSQMVLGKAWTSFPCCQQQQESGCYENPIHICLKLCQTLFQDIPSGSIVVACSDVILLLLDNDDKESPLSCSGVANNDYNKNAASSSRRSSYMISWQEEHASSVLVLAVPTALETAQNHGVFVLGKRNNDTHAQQQQQQQQNGARENKEKDLEGMNRMRRSTNSNNGTSSTSSTSSSSSRVFPCRAIYQKPNWETLMQHCAFFSSSCNNINNNNNNNSNNNRKINKQEKVAWTDTGIVVFLPNAAKALVHLAVDTELSACTATGLEKQWQKEQQQQQQQEQEQQSTTTSTINSSSTIQEFAAKVAPSIDLYTDFLYALSRGAGGESSSSSTKSGILLDDKENTLASYRQRRPNLSPSIAAIIHETLSPFELEIWTIPHGKMLHLGTTRELMDYYILGAAAAAPATTGATAEPAGATAADGWAGQNKGLLIENGLTTKEEGEEGANHHRSFLCRESGRQLGFVRRLDCMIQIDTAASASSSSARQISSSTVIFNSLLQAKENLVIGEKCVLEHNMFQTNGSIRIGNDCLVSGLRVTVQDEDDGLELPDSIMVQKVALLMQTPNTQRTNDDCGKNGDALFVYMVLGIDDAIKMGSIIYNQSLDDFLQWGGMTKDDLWPTGSDHILWHAKVHPVVSQESYMSLFAWLVPFAKNTRIADDNDAARRLSLERWKSATRLSLADIRDASNALMEFNSRTVIIPQEMTRHKTSHLNTMDEILLGRRHAAIDLQFAVDSYAFGGHQLKDVLLALHALDRVITKSFADETFDICGRACMVSNAFLLELEMATHAGQTLELETSLLDEKELERVSGITIIPGHTYSETVSIICSSLLSKLRQSAQVCVFEQVALLRDFLLKATPGLALPHLSNLMESTAHFMTQKCVVGSHDLQALLHSRDSPVLDQWVLAAAPARIDLAGGWSDTPPICFEFGGAVTGIAVKIDNMKPLVCRSRIVQGCGGGILLRTEHRGYNCELHSDIQTEVRTYEDMHDYQDPTADCTLLKCALICLGFVNPSDIRDKRGSLQSAIDSFCGVPEGTVARLEIVSSSMVPHGSGLGTSSILGGCVLAAIAKSVGIQFGPDYHDLIRGILILEQHLTTGGGWQDQANGLVGGAKIVTCNPYVFPLDLSIEQLALDKALVEDLDARLVLVFTGKTRLAKNILGKALGQWSKRTRSIVGNLSNLVDGAKSARDALVAGDLDSLGATLSSYWEQKKLMCGPESGVEPIIVSKILNTLKESKMIRGGALCGAGGGGFLALLLQDNVAESDLAAVLNEIGEGSNDGGDNMSLHKCTICESGLTISVLAKNIQDSSPQFFDPLWLSSENA